MAPLLLLLVGFGLVLAEVFFPSFGALSLLAGAALIGAVILGYQESHTMGTGILIATIVGLPLLIFMAFRAFPKTRIGRRMISPGTEWSDEERQAVQEGVGDLLGKTGFARGPLRPAGIAEIEGRRVDVVTRGGLIEAGSPIRVLRLEGNRIVVEAVADSQPDATVE